MPMSSHPLQVSGQPPRVSCGGDVVAQLCPILCYPVDCSLPDFSVHEISHARLLEWVAIPFSRGSSQLGDGTRVFCLSGRFFTN